MNLRQLSQFVALAETGNFHRAAERLHMAQLRIPRDGGHDSMLMADSVPA